MKNTKSKDRTSNFKLIKVFGLYSGRNKHGVTSVRAFISGDDAIITREQERRALRRIHAIGGDSLMSDKYYIIVEK